MKPLASSHATDLCEAGRRAAAAGLYQEAIGKFRHALSLEPHSLEALFDLACCLVKSGDMTGAVAAFRRCMLEYPNHADSAYNLAWLFDKRGDVAGAIAHYRLCLSRDPDHLEGAFNLAACLRRSGDLAGAVAAYRACIARHPAHFDSAYNLGCCLQEMGDLAEAIIVYRRCCSLQPDHLDSAYNLAGCLQMVGDVESAIGAYRACLLRHPGDFDSAFNLASLLAEGGHYDEALPLIEDLQDRHPDDDRVLQNLASIKWQSRMARSGESDERLGLHRILVACMPKSGSTFLADVLARLPGMRRVHLVPDYGRREQELDLEQVINHQRLSYVSQLHVRPSKLTLRMIKTFSLKPVFLFRNIWDIMASLRDHMYANSLEWSMTQIDPAFRSWDEGQQYDFLAQAMMPWFIDFYVSWTQVSMKLAVSYEQLMADPVATVGAIAVWGGLVVSASEIERAIAATGQAATFNKGGSGRGEAVPATARAHVRTLASYYPHVDFEPLLGADAASRRQLPGATGDSENPRPR